MNKVIEAESVQGNNSGYTIANKAWQKNIAHFAGGSDSSEQVYIKNRLKDFENTIKDTLYGGNVKNFGKNPFTSQIDFTEFQNVQEYLEEGVSIMTFFGHSSSGYGFSQNIDEPSNWNNQGKYPLVIGLGCYSGDVHNPDTNSFSEQLIRPLNSGAIGFISTIKQGFIPYINNYTEYLYKNIGKHGYGNTIGQQMLMTIDSMDQISSSIISGPIPIPSRRTIYTILRSPHVNKKARDQFEIRTHQRLMDILDPTDKTVDALMKLDLAAGVDVEIKL